MLRLIDSGLTDPRAGVALDATLFRALEDSPRSRAETLRFWESQGPAVIVGHLGVIRLQVYERTCLADNVPIIRRLSGGGAVFVGPGCLNYSLVLSLDHRPELRDVRDSYRIILRRLVDALGLPGLGARGISDLAFHDQKVSGSAQRRGRWTLLHHGTFLYAFDIRRLERYLKEPDHQPAYRAGRCHTAFVSNAPCGPEAIKAALTSAWDAR